MSTRLPVTRSLVLPYALSLLIAILLILASAGGLLYQDAFYPTAALRASFVANDVVNLSIGLPVLLGSLWLARRGRLLGLLFWPGALFYVLYNATAYLFALPLNVAFLLNLLLVTATVYTMAALVSSIDAQAVGKTLSGTVPERMAASALFLLGVAYFLLSAVMFAGAVVNQAPLGAVERATHVADFLIAPAYVIGGLLLWRRQPLGYVAGMGLLFQASMLFVGLIVFLLLQPLISMEPFEPVDVVVVAIMGLVCFIPFALFARGVLANEHVS